MQCTLGQRIGDDPGANLGMSAGVRATRKPVEPVSASVQRVHCSLMIMWSLFLAFFSLTPSFHRVSSSNISALHWALVNLLYSTVRVTAWLQSGTVTSVWEGQLI